MAKHVALCSLPPEEMSIQVLIGEIAKYYCNTLSSKSDDLGVAVGFRAILFYLGINDGVTQLELSRLTGLKPPTVSVSLQKMENDGLVARIDDKDDLRKTIVTLTDKGRDVCDKISEAYHDCNRVVTEILDENEQEVLKSLLIKIFKNISDGKEG